MKNNAKNTQSSRISALRVIVTAVILFLFFSVIFAPSVADAVCPDGYIENVKDKNLDWQNGEDELNLEYVKTRVKSWLSDPQYDFSALEKDPIVVAVVDTGINFDHEIFTGKYDENGVATADKIGRYDVLLRNEKGDIITEFGGKAIGDYTELEGLVEECKPNDKVNVKIYRSGRYRH